MKDRAYLTSESSFASASYEIIVAKFKHGDTNESEFSYIDSAAFIDKVYFSKWLIIYHE